MFSTNPTTNYLTQTQPTKGKMYFLHKKKVKFHCHVRLLEGYQLPTQLPTLNLLHPQKSKIDTKQVAICVKGSSYLFQGPPSLLGTWMSQEVCKRIGSVGYNPQYTLL